LKEELSLKEEIKKIRRDGKWYNTAANTFIGDFNYKT
jgi:hypothetical protein